MAIELITGLPGNAKTLYTIGYVKAWAERENRPVFYHGIPELTLDWQLIEPTEWAKCPPGSIVVIDEAQKIFRNRSLGAMPPQYVQDLETHRHKGIDLVFITQHPTLIDPAVRKLTQKHRHLVRMFGMEVSTVHTWHSVRDNCDKPVARKDSEKQRWAFDKSIYKLYKSAEVHTVKRSIPLRAKLLVMVPLAVFGAGWFVYATLVKPKTDRAVDVPVAAAAVSAGAGSPGRMRDRPGRDIDPLQDAKEYAFMNTPRIDGLTHTAPKYDEITKPVRAPVPAMCIQRGGASSQTTCKCYTQQGTPMDVNLTMCLGFARNGWFQDFDADRDREETERSNRSVAALAGRVPEHPLPSSRSGPVVVSMAAPVAPPAAPAVKDDGPPPNRSRFARIPGSGEMM